jgi:hypothetical protein
MFRFEWLWRQIGTPPSRWSDPRCGQFLMSVLAYNVALAALAWFIVGLVTR